MKLTTSDAAKVLQDLLAEDKTNQQELMRECFLLSKKQRQALHIAVAALAVDGDGR